MYLSSLLIDVGENPDRPRPGRLWLRNLYRVHQRLCMAFPSRERKRDDPSFLKPFDPSGLKHVHGPRTAQQAFLFRIDSLANGRAMIIVQSAREPDWSYAFHNARHFLAAGPQVKEFDPCFDKDQVFQFRLLANPVRKVSPRSLDSRGKPFDERWIGKDVPVATPDLDTWLERRAEPRWSPPKNSENTQSPPGFRLLKIIHIEPGYAYVSKTRERGAGRRLRSARYDGMLEVTDMGHFRNTLISGIGPGKAFGFGMLSLAPPPKGA